MQLRPFSVAVMLALIGGCGPGGGAVTVEPGLKDHISEFEMVLGDARGTLNSAKSTQRSGEEDDKPQDVIAGALKMVASSAEQLARSSAGQATESDAKAILIEAQELATKSKGKADPTEPLQGLQSLATKAAAMKAKLPQ